MVQPLQVWVVGLECIFGYILWTLNRSYVHIEHLPHLEKALLRECFICDLFFFDRKLLGLRFTCPQLVPNSNREEKTNSTRHATQAYFLLRTSKWATSTMKQPRSREWWTPTPFSRQNFPWTSTDRRVKVNTVLRWRGPWEDALANSMLRP